jgi:hypothetical protein
MPPQIDLKAAAERSTVGVYGSCMIEADPVMRSLHIVHKVMVFKTGCVRRYFCKITERNLMNSYWDSCTVNVSV